MKTTRYVCALLAALLPLGLLGGCDGGECDDTASCLPPPPPMVAEVSDVSGGVPVSGTLSFGQGTSTDGVLIEVVTLRVSGPSVGPHVGLDANFTRAIAADLVAGRVVVPPLAAVWYDVGTARVRRETRSVQMTVERDQSVTLVFELGDFTDVTAVTSPEPPLPGPPLDLPGTATMTVRGPLRLECWYSTAAGSQYDREFTSRYCAPLRTELALDALVARSLRL